MLVGGVGTGKTHLAIALGMACCQHDYRVRFLTAAELTTLLVEAQQQGRLARKLDQLVRFDVVILDELGYVPFDKAGADLLFGFISRRYERGSLVVTTNLPFARWSEVFLDATAAAAVIDRIVHHATGLTTNGDSYRLKAAQRNQTAHARQKKTRSWAPVPTSPDGAERREATSRRPPYRGVPFHVAKRSLFSLPFPLPAYTRSRARGVCSYSAALARPVAACASIAGRFVHRWPVREPRRTGGRCPATAAPGHAPVPGGRAPLRGAASYEAEG